MALAFANAIAASSFKRSASSLAFSLLLRLARASSSFSISSAERDSISAYVSSLHLCLFRYLDRYLVLAETGQHNQRS